MIPDFGKRSLVKTFRKIIDLSLDESEILEFVSTRGRERYSDFQNVRESVFVNYIAARSGEGISLLSCFVRERSKFVCLKTTRVTKRGRECVRVFGFVASTMLLVRKYFTNSSCKYG